MFLVRSDGLLAPRFLFPSLCLRLAPVPCSYSRNLASSNPVVPIALDGSLIRVVPIACTVPPTHGGPISLGGSLNDFVPISPRMASSTVMLPSREIARSYLTFPSWMMAHSTIMFLSRGMECSNLKVHSRWMARSSTVFLLRLL